MTTPTPADVREALAEILANDEGADMARADADRLADAILSSGLVVPAPRWMPIETVPKDGTEVWVYLAEREGLPAFQTRCAWHPDAGWCACELREVTHWMPLPTPPEEQP